MMGPPIYLLFVVLSVFSVVSADDASVILKIAAAFTSRPSDWSTTSSSGYCRWTGIKCGSSGSITGINLNSKSIAGTLPQDISSLSELQTLALQRNSLHGDLPSFADMGSLQEIYLDNNNFTSVPSGAFGKLASLRILSLSNNGGIAPWSFPIELTDSSTLTTLYLDETNINGPLPDIFESFPSLVNVRLSYNNLTGPLPASLGKSSIQNFWINNQKMGLSGTLDVLSGMAQLFQAWLQKNQFTGSIPDLSKCVNLMDLQVRDNQLTGIVPPSINSLSTLANISLDNNKLQGPTPAFSPNVVKFTYDDNNFCTTEPGKNCDPQVTVLLEVAGAMGYPVMLSDSWKGNSACNGWSSVTCDTTGAVISVTLGKHGFAGTISPTIANLTSLKNLILNGNNLTGPIPPALTKLTSLQFVDVSNNNLTGDIPVFPPSVKFVYKPGNLLLGSKNSGGGGGGSPSGPNDDGSGGNSSRSKSASLIIGVIVAVLVFFAIACFVLYKFILKKKYGKFGKVQNPDNRKGQAKNMVFGGGGGGINGYGGIASELNSQSSGDHSDRHVFEGGNVAISIEVLRQVTDNFSEGNILGRGGFGTVYKGELHDGTKIAVKRMESSAMGTKGMNEFQAEIAVLTKVRHRHLVALLGSCINGNERLLVYEYMPQGTLGQHLFEWRELGFAPLTWKQRVTIALDVARGVEYLHSLAQQSFIHRDLKPSNILLGDDMRAKVADFGLVKNAPDGKYSVETRLAGTFGYLAPEYAGKWILCRFNVFV